MSKDNKKKPIGGGVPEVYQDPTPRQEEGQEVPPAEGNAQGEGVALTASKLKAKIALEPTAVVDQLPSKMTGGADSGAGNGTRSAAGFGSKAGDASRISYRDKAKRPASLDGKTHSEDARDIDQVSSEFVIPKVDEALAFKDSNSADQVYSGRKTFIKERGKKNHVSGPQDLLFNNSVDYDISDFTIATCGQVAGTPAPQADYPTKDINGFPIVDPMHKSNYLLEKLRFTIADGRIKSIRFDETKIPVPVNDVSADETNYNWQIDRNVVHKAVDILQIKHGNEKKEDWSPMGYAIDNPYEVNMLLHDMEATTGAMVAAALRSCVSSVAHQRNVVNKEGDKTAEAAVRMFVEGYLGSISDSESIANGSDISAYVTNQNAYRKGCAAAIIAMADRPNDKYVSKSDFLLFRNGLDKSISEGFAHYKPFHVKKDFLKVLDKVHLYSTMDGSYSPVLPIYATRNVHVINPLSLNYFLKDWKHPSDLERELKEAYHDGDEAYEQFVENTYDKYDKDTGIKRIYGYAYNDETGETCTHLIHPVVFGIVKWLLDHEAKVVKVFGNGETVMPCSFNFLNPSLFQHVMCASMRDMLKGRKDSMINLIYGQMQDADYTWADMVALGDEDPCKSTQCSLSWDGRSISVGKVSEDNKIRLAWGTNMHAIAVDGNNAISYTLPWYVSEDSFPVNTANGYNPEVGYRVDSDNAYSMNIPSVRQGVNHASVDIIQSKAPSEIRLALDRITEVPIPVHYSTTVGLFNVCEPNFSDEDKLSDVDNVALAAIKYDSFASGRMVVRYRTDLSALVGGFVPVSDLTLLSAPKELGWIWCTPPSLIPVIGSVTAVSGGAITPTFVRDTVTAGGQNALSFNSREVRSYRNKFIPTLSANTEQGAATYQVFKTGYADPNLAAVNAEYTNFSGVVMDISYSNCGFEEKSCVKVIGSNAKTPSSAAGITGFFSNAKLMWSMLQRMYIPDSPFYGCYDDATAMGKSDFKAVDPLETSYYFGYCGMLPTRYSIAITNRKSNFDLEDSDYVEDVFTKKSLIFQ